MDNLLLNIAKIGKSHSVSQVILFGSRARGDHHEKSDYDIAFVSSQMTPELKCSISAQLDVLDTFHKIDAVFLNDLNGTDELTLNIRKDGVVLVNKFETKLSNYKNALKKLCDGLSDYEKAPLETVRDGVIQRFEFTTELAWKTAREHLHSEGVVHIDTPKAVLKEAFFAGLIEDEGGWLQILTDRNATSHIYDEQEAAEIFERIKTKHLTLFQLLSEKLG